MRLARLLLCLVVAAVCRTTATELSIRSADERNFALALVEQSWAAWNASESGQTAGYCFVTMQYARNAPCTLTRTLLRCLPDAGQFQIGSAAAAVRRCSVADEQTQTCRDCGVKRQQLDVEALRYDGDNVVDADVDSALLTMQQWYQWCTAQLASPLLRIDYVQLFNDTGYLRLCGYQNLSCSGAGCFYGVMIEQLAANTTHACLLPPDKESRSHEIESVALAIAFGAVFLLVLVGASLVVFVKQQRKKARLQTRQAPLFSPSPTTQYQEITLFDDSDTSSSSASPPPSPPSSSYSSSSDDGEELGLN